MEVIFSIFITIVEATITACIAVLDFLASFFVASGQTLSAVDLVVVILVVFVELVCWLCLWLKELLKALFVWRKPTYVAKPVIWRPKPKLKAARGKK